MAIFGTNATPPGTDEADPQTPTANGLRIERFSPASDGDLLSISYYTTVANASEHMKAVVYADNAGAPGALKGVSAILTGVVTNGYNTMTFTTPVHFSAGPIWIGVAADADTNTWLIAGGSGSTDQNAEGAYASPPDPFSGTASTMKKYVFATFAYTGSFAESVTASDQVACSLKTTGKPSESVSASSTQASAIKSGLAQVSSESVSAGDAYAAFYPSGSYGTVESVSPSDSITSQVVLGASLLESVTPVDYIGFDGGYDMSSASRDILMIQGDPSGAPIPTTNFKAATAAVTQVASSNTNVTLKAANAGRLGLTVYNDSTQIMYLKLGTTASSTSYTVQMDPHTYFEVPFGYVGNIDAIWVAANGNAYVTELTL